MAATDSAASPSERSEHSEITSATAPAATAAVSPTAPSPTAVSPTAPSPTAVSPTYKAWTARPVAVLATIVLSAVLLGLFAMASNTEPLDTPLSSDQRTIEPFENFDTGRSEGREPTANSQPAAEPREPRQLPNWLYYTLGVLAAAGALWFLALQRLSFKVQRAKAKRTTTESEPTEEEEAAEIVAFTVDLIDELGADGDPRLAIQRAYAAVETGFGKRELERKPAETPGQYLHRALGRNGAVAEPLERLTTLFETARYSSHEIDESMRSDAIDALSEIRDSYRRFIPVRNR